MNFYNIYKEMKRHILLIIILFFLFGKTFSQHTGHHNHDTINNKMNIENDSQLDSLYVMSHSFSENLPMNRNGSGTSWQPDYTPIYGYMKHLGKWNFMLHGNIYLRYTYQDINNVGTRGNKMLGAPNWIMLMGQRNVRKRGLFHFNGMFSLDRFTEGGNGYPLLFQTGESWNGKKLVDRQHPHDLFSELSIAYTHMVNKNIDVTIYIGYPGEPAIGPTAFMHRISAFNNPDAPLGHHWQDATHITFGVATFGIRYKKFKFDASCFTGREPDENRFDFDKPMFDSYSHRLTFNPTSYLSMQVSNAFLNSPEALESDQNIRRTTASICYNIMLSEQNHFTNTFVFGQNQSNDKSVTSSFLLESNLQLKKLAIYCRYEAVQKTAEDLALESTFDIHEKIRVHAFALGTNYILATILNTNMVIGIQASVFKTKEILYNVYGKNPLSGQIYLRINPALMKMGSI